MSRLYSVTALISLWLFSLILFFMFNKSLGDGISLNNVKNNETSESLERMKKRIDDIQLQQSEILDLLASLPQQTDVTDNKSSIPDVSKQSRLEKITPDELDQQSGIQNSNFDIAAFTEKYTNNYSFDDQLMMEVVDFEWTNQVSSRVNAVLKNKMVSGTEVVKNECKLTLCKFEFKHKDTESAELFNQFFQKKLRWRGTSQSYSVVRSNGDIETKLYLMRKK